MNTKKFAVLIMMIAFALATLVGCSYTPPPSLEDDNNDNDNGGYVGNLVEQDFNSALEAFQFGEHYFNNETSFYETTQKSVAVAMGFNTYAFTKRYKSDVTNNFLYETNTYSNMNNPDPSFGLKAYTKADEDTVYFKRVDGKYHASTNPHGSRVEELYSSNGYLGSVSDFTGLDVETKENWSEYKQNIGGNIPDMLSVYLINADTIESSTFKKDENGYAYQFSFTLKEAAIEDYARQVVLYSKQGWNSFTSCEINFKMDKYGRIEQININEIYKVAASGAIAAVNNQSVEYISYSKRPKIEFMDTNATITGTNITYAELDTSETPIETFKITFDSMGGFECEDITVYYNSEIGTLPIPTHELSMAHFVGWFTQPNGRGEQFKEDDLFVIKSDLELYAHWQYVDTQYGTYTLNEDDEYELTAIGALVNGAFVVPETYMGKPVVSIGAEAFKNNTKVTVVMLSSFIHTIGESAFSGSSLRSLAFLTDSNLTTIGKAAFKDCASLTYVELSDPLEEIGEEAFSGCKKLSEIALPNTLKIINKRAFFNCTILYAGLDVANSNLESIQESAFENASIRFESTPNSLKQIGVKAFFNCTFNTTALLANFVISAHVEEISDSAFGQVSPSFYLFIEFAQDSKLTRIGRNAFAKITGLAGVKGLPEGLTIIDDSAFNGCTSLYGTDYASEDMQSFLPLVLPSTVSSIGQSAFAGCTNLVVDISNTKITAISNNAFQNCTSLTSFIMPSSIMSIGSNAFNGCSKLASMDLKDTQTATISGNAFQNCASLVSVTLPATLTSIGNSAFSGCSKLASINLEDTNLSTIGNNTFQNCTSLNSIALPETLVGIGNYAFSGCSKLASINLEDTAIIAIGNNTFQNCSSLTKVILPVGVNSIGSNAFNGCTSLVSIVILKADEVVSLSAATAIPSANVDLKIYVAFDLVDIYKTTNNWNNANVKNKIEAIRLNKIIKT